MKILVINGPNLNRLGKRKAEHYGTMTLDDLMEMIRAHAKALKVEVEFFQSNHEGAIIDVIHTCEDQYEGVVINPGAFTHYSYAIRDAIESVSVPFVEAHLSDIKNRESFRSISVTAPVCVKQIYGLKEMSYFKALDFLVEAKHAE